MIYKQIYHILNKLTQMISPHKSDTSQMVFYWKRKGGDGFLGDQISPFITRTFSRPPQMVVMILPVSVFLNEIYL